MGEKANFYHLMNIYGFINSESNQSNIRTTGFWYISVLTSLYHKTPHYV